MRWHARLIGALFCSAALAQQSGEEVDSARLPAEKMPLADQSLLLDAANTRQRTVVVGERGHVLLSEDRQQWRQAASVPTRSTLTAVTAVGDTLWAVGHDEVIIYSNDGGEHWELQHANPAQTAEDDPNPLLDVLFVDQLSGIAVGAYGRILVTDDGGSNWTVGVIGDLIASTPDNGGEAAEEPADTDAEVVEESVEDFEDFQDEYFDYHLNAIVRLSDGTLFIAAEAGNAYLSTDGGDSWTRAEFPYEGSMFGVQATADDTLIAHGLRGHVLVSRDRGASWETADTRSQNSLMGGTILEDGSIVLVGASGEILKSESVDGTFRSYQHPDGSDLSDAVAMTGNTLLLVGEDGITTYTPGGNR